MLQVDSVLQKRKKYSRNIRKRNVCGIKKTVSFFRAVKTGADSSEGIPLLAYSACVALTVICRHSYMLRIV